ncbi:MAG TPA: C-GCAxxG-C-C family protein [Candidatus Bathyarchaeia archaeon]|nr:C-GCAxxG-C-C family protein [Candidatus Bathyarchaeia archaeon]
MVEDAKLRFREGFVCSESVLMTFSESFQMKSEIIPRIASGFGGGIGRKGSICGALAGAIMSLGLKYGRNKSDETDALDVCQEKSSECYERFEKEMGSVNCRDLIQCDISTVEGRKKWREQGLRENKCTKYIENSMKILLSLIDDEK